MFKFVKPESVGYNSTSLKRLRDKLDNNLRIHTFMIAKGDKIFFSINNGLYNEYSLHRMYSETKSLVALAIGLLYDDKKIKLSDKISKYFPEYIDKNTDKVLLNQTIEDTLRMGTCVTCADWFTSPIKDRVKLYFQQKHNRKCMSKFEYDSAGSMVLAALVEKLTKQDLFKFLYDRILKHLKYFDDAYILKTPCGRSWGDSGLMASSIAMLSLGRFVLNKGEVNNKQLLSEEYIAKATKKYLETKQEKAKYKRYGYGYQIWMVKEGFAFVGLGNQITIMYPKLDIVVTITGSGRDKVNEIRDYIFDEVYKIINKKEKLNHKKIEYSHKIDIFKNEPLNKDLLKKYANKTFLSNTFIKSFKLNKQEIIFNSNFKIKLNGTYKTIIKDIFTKDRIVKLPKYSIYDLYVGVEKSTNNQLVLQGQIIGDYLGSITLNIIFKENGATLSLRSYTENFLRKYNGEFNFKLK